MSPCPSVFGILSLCVLTLPRRVAGGVGLSVVESGHFLVKSALSNVIKKGKKMAKSASRFFFFFV